jgi:hypothetical protein
MASIATLKPSGLFPDGEVVGGRSWARRTGGDRGPNRVFDILLRGLCAYFQDWLVFSFLLRVLVVIWSVTAII